MKQNKDLVRYGIASLYVFCLFMLIGRLICAVGSPVQDFAFWLGQQIFLIKVAIWLPFMIGVVMLAIVFFRNIKAYNKKPLE